MPGDKNSGKMPDFYVRHTWIQIAVQQYHVNTKNTQSISIITNIDVIVYFRKQLNILGNLYPIIICLRKDTCTYMKLLSNDDIGKVN